MHLLISTLINTLAFKLENYFYMVIITPYEYIVNPLQAKVGWLGFMAYQPL